jgi:hypothetical protein
VRFGVLAVLALAAVLLSVFDPHHTTPSPTAPENRAPTSAWSQLPSTNDNCADVFNGPAGNAMRVLVGNGTTADECAGGELWSPVQQSVITDANAQPLGE